MPFSPLPRHIYTDIFITYCHYAIAMLITPPLPLIFRRFLR
jgi:hypothetical protein